MARLSEFSKGILSLTVVLFLLVGVPVILIAVVGIPLPTEMPSLSLILRHIRNGEIPDAVVLKTLALVVWIVWVQLAIAIVVETTALLQGRVSGRMALLPGLQAFIGGLVASTVLIVSSLTPGRPAAGIAPIVPIDQLAASDLGATAAGSSQQGETASDSPVGVVADANGRQSAESEIARAPSPHAVGQYATKSGDNWWDMAERLLGDGMRWSELRDLNAGKTMVTGDVISGTTETVRSGWRLDVPGDAEPSLLETAVSIAQAEPSRAEGSDDSPESLVAESPERPKPVQPDESADSDESPATHLQLLSERPESSSTAPAPNEIVPTQTIGYGTENSPPYTLVYEGTTGVVDRGPGVPYQVTEGDNLWDIAERHLGDPLRWPEIFERSTDLQQSFGRTISDPNLIWPDSILWLPTDAFDVPQADGELVADVVGALHPSDEPDADEPVAVTPEDIDRAAKGAMAAASMDEGAVSENGRDPVAPEHATTPSTGSPPPPLSGPPPPPLSGPPPPPPSGSPPPPDPDSAPANPSTQRGVPATAAFGAGGVLVASGLLGLLRRSRRLRLSEAGERSLPEQPPLELVEIETVLRSSSDVGLASSIYRAISSLSARPIVVGEPLAAPEVVRFFGDEVEVLQHRHDPDLPTPWERFPGRLPESLGDRTVARAKLARFAASDGGDGIDGSAVTSSAPACISIGRGLMVNLEALGVVSIVGSLEASAGLVRSMIHELATGPARRSVEVRVSDWLPGADLHAHVRCGPLDNLSEQLAGWLETVDLNLAGTGGFSAYAIRASDLDTTPIAPMVIFADVEDAPHLQPLVERAADHAVPLAIVFSGELSETEIQPQATIRLEGDVTQLEPHGFVAASQYLDDDLMIGTEALLAHARQAPMVARANGHGLMVVDVDTDEANATTEESSEHDIMTERPDDVELEITDQATGGDGGLLIRVLGPLEVDGGSLDFGEEQLSLLAFLALVGPSTKEQLLDAIWPEDQIDDDRFEQIITELRTGLQHRFPDNGDGRYRVRSVVTDLGSARRWLAQAESMAPDRSRNMLEMALGDVRGEPFAAVNERWWQWTADHKMAIATQASTMLMDACFDLCDSAYGANDLHLAKWACDVGATIDPLHETVAIRRVQLMQILGLHDEALVVVNEWETLFAEVAERPPPRGPRAALGVLGANKVVTAPHVG